MIDLTLYIPGLLRFSKYDLYEDFTAPAALTSVLNYSARVTTTSEEYCATLAALFACPIADNEDFPAAAISRLIDDAERPQGTWLRADPVYLSTDAHGVTLYDGIRHELDLHEALALAARLFPLFDESGYTLEVPDARRWYVQLPHTPKLQTQSVYAARGQSILTRMPVGNDGQDWTQLLNEVQMLLHDADVNRQRQSRKLPPVNSVWFWGCGQLPNVLERRWSAVFAEDVIVRGLSMLSATPCYELETFFPRLAEQDNRANFLVVMDSTHAIAAYQDVAAWHDALLQLEQKWLQPIVNQIYLNRIKTLNLIVDGCRFRFSKWQTLKFWQAWNQFQDHLQISAR